MESIRMKASANWNLDLHQIAYAQRAVTNWLLCRYRRLDRRRKQFHVIHDCHLSVVTWIIDLRAQSMRYPHGKHVVERHAKQQRSGLDAEWDTRACSLISTKNRWCRTFLARSQCSNLIKRQCQSWYCRHMNTNLIYNLTLSKGIFEVSNLES